MRIRRGEGKGEEKKGEKEGGRKARTPKFQGGMLFLQLLQETFCLVPHMP
jgi:hypothetical protein